MSEVMKDSAIKLFGKTITLLPDQVVADFSVSEQRQSSFSTSTSQDSKSEISGEDFTENRHESESINPTKETLTTEAATSSEISDDTDTPQTPKKEETSDQSNASQEKTTLQKPDKILPCPRCNSMDTKFCYYNNYNVNQPRHFCKNCQRYWTSGGTMRNVPVGSGRRKSKNAVFPDFRHIMVADTLQAARVDAINGIHLPSLKPNGFLIGGFPVSFYPYSESAAPNCWNAPLVSSAASICPNSSLGKHSREGNMVRTSNLGKENLDGERERSVLIPKTLRIHDPSEAAKSSIWSTLGIKREKNGSFSGRGIFKAFESKGDRGVDNTTLVLQANPAALCRSINFRESA